MLTVANRIVDIATHVSKNVNDINNDTHTIASFLFARVDLVEYTLSGVPHYALMELELIEPLLFLSYANIT